MSMPVAYPGKSRAALQREARKRATRPPKWMRRSNPVAPALARNGSRKCDCKGCPALRYGLGRYCAYHASNLRQTGHPIARNLRRADWRPFVVSCEAFVAEQISAGHAGILAGLRWIAEELERAEHPASHDPAHRRYAAAVVRANRHGVDATAFLARWIAGELADDRGREVGPRFADDVHAAHQRARLFLYPLPFGDASASWAKRKRVPQPPMRSSRIPWSVRAYTFARLNAALCVLAIKAVAEMRRRTAVASALD